MMDIEASVKPSRRESRQRAILEAANALFLEKGYGATNLTDIVKVSGGSLATLYELFGGKAGLFRAMIEKECVEFFDFLEREIPAGEAPRETLRALAKPFFEQVFDEEGGSLVRLVAAEASQFPEVGAAFFAAGPATAQRLIADYLGRESWQNVLRIEDTQGAARTFISLLLDDYQLRQICGLPVKLTRKEIDRHVDRVVEDFMKIYRAPERLHTK